MTILRVPEQIELQKTLCTDRYTTKQFPEKYLFIGTEERLQRRSKGY
jgi:hypothetical protein